MFKLTQSNDIYRMTYRSLHINYNMYTDIARHPLAKVLPLASGRLHRPTRAVPPQLEPPGPARPGLVRPGPQPPAWPCLSRRGAAWQSVGMPEDRITSHFLAWRLIAWRAH